MDSNFQYAGAVNLVVAPFFARRLLVRVLSRAVALLRNRKFADSPLEEDGFEPSVPPAKRATLSAGVRCRCGTSSAGNPGPRGFLLYMFVVPVGRIPTLLSTGVGYSVTAMAVASRSHPIATESPRAAGGSRSWRRNRQGDGRRSLTSAMIRDRGRCSARSPSRRALNAPRPRAPATNSRACSRTRSA